MPSAPEATLDSRVAGDWWEIEPKQTGVIERARELWRYRYLWWYFASDTITSMFRRSQLGWLWLLLRVTAPVGLNAIIFGGVLGVDSGTTPYFLFFLCGTTTWVLFERSLLFVTRSLESNRKLITKVYFPRLILPMSAIAPGLMYLAILLLVTVGTVIYYYRTQGVWYITLRPELLASVAAIVLSLTFTVAVGLWTSVLQARYRDIRYGMRYLMPFWMYFTPIIYPVTMLPEKWRWVVAINPMAPIVELFKWGTLGQGHLTVASLVTALVLITVTMISGMWFFNREEAASVDKL
jgi:homopolymeric O-antigen transport system permease protein